MSYDTKEDFCRVCGTNVNATNAPKPHVYRETIENGRVRVARYCLEHAPAGGTR